MRARLQASLADPRRVDAALVSVLLVVGEVDMLTSSHRRGPVALNVLGIAALTMCLLARRGAPLAALGALLSIGFAQTLWLTHLPDLFTGVFSLMAASYAVGAYASRRRALLAFPIGFLGVLAVSLAERDPASDVVFPMIFFLAAPWLLGRTIRNRSALTRELHDRAARLEREREERARRAVVDERTRIARELHDVVAHHVSVMVIQAGAARRIAPRDPRRAADAAELIEWTGREALGEMRRLFGALHREDADIALAAQPSLTRVRGLAESARAAGLPVELRVEGDPVALSPGLDLAAYRVVQEALTNAIKHAGPAHARVTVRYRADRLDLEVADDGRGPGRTPGDAGHGLVGMRERIALYGGELRIGRRRGGGFSVRARIPLDTVTSA
jgi:signal transduction histidine kinase